MGQFVDKREIRTITKTAPFRVPAVIALFALMFASTALSDVQPRGNGRYLQSAPVQSISANGLSTVVLTTPEPIQSSGSVTIIAGRSDSINFEAELEIQADSREDAQRQLETFTVIQERTNSELRLTISVGSSAQSRIDFSRSQLHVSIAIPEGMDISLNTPYLATEVDGAVGDISISKTMAPIRIEGARGVVTATISNSRATINQHLGGLNLTATNTRIRLTNISINKSNSVSNEIAKIVSEDGDVEVNNYTGPVDIAVVRGLIQIRDIRLHGTSCRLKNDGGEIDVIIDRIEPNVHLSVTNRYDDIKLTLPADVDTRLRLRTFGDSEFYIDGIQHQISYAKTDRIEAICGDGSADIDIQSLDGGTIQITGK